MGKEKGGVPEIEGMEKKKGKNLFAFILLDMKAANLVGKKRQKCWAGKEEVKEGKFERKGKPKQRSKKEKKR